MVFNYLKDTIYNWMSEYNVVWRRIALGNDWLIPGYASHLILHNHSIFNQISYRLLFFFNFIFIEYKQDSTLEESLYRLSLQPPGQSLAWKLFIKIMIKARYNNLIRIAKTMFSPYNYLIRIAILYGNYYLHIKILIVHSS